MKIEKQVCALEYALCLKELGVKQDSLVYWLRKPDLCKMIPTDIEGQFKHKILTYEYFIGSPEASDIWEGEILCSAFTTAELGEILPGQFRIGKKDLELYWECYIESEKIENLYLIDCIIPHKNTSLITFKDNNEANCRAKMLIHLIENGLYKV